MTAARRSASIRVSAKPNSAVNSTIWTIDPSAAALTMFDGISWRTKSPSVGTDAAVAPASTPANPARSASPALVGSGNRLSSSGITTAPNNADNVSTTAIQMIDRPATPPARAASVPPTIPPISSATISGMTVILSASSHSPPMVAATLTAGSRHAPPACAAKAPIASPTTSAPSTRHVAPIGGDATNSAPIGGDATNSGPIGGNASVSLNAPSGTDRRSGRSCPGLPGRTPAIYDRRRGWPASCSTPPAGTRRARNRP